MTKQTEALKMAIEYLTNIQLDYKGHELRKACKEALEQEDYEKRGLEFENENFKKELDAAMTMLNKQPAQEPVAWMNDDGLMGLYKHSDTSIPLYTHPAPSWQGLDEYPTKQEILDSIFDAVYQSHKSWVGLSDDEIQEELKKMWDKGLIPSYSIVAFARAIEQALKEKNT